MLGMKRIKVGLNGFGRIGRAFTRIALMRDSFDIVLVNTRKTTPSIMGYLLQYDSVYRKFGKKIGVHDTDLVVENKTIHTSLSPDIEQIPWNSHAVDIVVDATGAFTTSKELKKHIKGSVKKVVLTAPSKDDETPHVVLGVNDGEIDFKSCSIISNCSCTTNSASPMFKVLDDSLKIVSGFLTTIHAYTSTQELLDDPAKNEERSRAAGLNIVPSSTGASTAVVKTLPHLEGKIDGMAVRVPVPIESFTDISAIVEKQTTVEEVNNLFNIASESHMKNVLAYETEKLVSSDYIGSPYSCVFDANYTKVIGENLVKIFGWYDNEWGYSSRLVDLVERLSHFV